MVQTECKVKLVWTLLRCSPFSRSKNSQFSDTSAGFFGKNINLAHIKLLSLFITALCKAMTADLNCRSSSHTTSRRTVLEPTGGAGRLRRCSRRWRAPASTWRTRTSPTRKGSANCCWWWWLRSCGAITSVNWYTGKSNRSASWSTDGRKRASSVTVWTSSPTICREEEMSSKSQYLTYLVLQIKYLHKNEFFVMY